MPEKILKEAEALREAAHELATDTAAIRDATLRTRRIVRALFVSLLLDLCLTIGLGINAIRTQHAVDRANRDRVGLVAACTARNTTSQAERDLWGFILSLPPAPGQRTTPPATIDEFKALLNQKFATQDCSKIK